MYDQADNASTHKDFARDSELDLGIQWKTNFQYQNANVIIDLGLHSRLLYVHRDVLCAESEYFHDLLTNDSVSIVRVRHKDEIKRIWLLSLRADRINHMAVLTNVSLKQSTPTCHTQADRNSTTQNFDMAKTTSSTLMS